VGVTPDSAGVQAVVAALIVRMRDDPAERRRRHGDDVLASMALDSAQRGRLRLPSPCWWTDFELDADGVLHVLVGDPPASGRDRAAANVLELNFALFGALPVFPELQSLLPSRPADATTCEHCGGTGVPPWVANHPDVGCNCGGAGWLPAGAAEMTRFADELDFLASTPAEPASREGGWPRLRRWLGIG
jgi:hypothetical protein